MIAALKTAGAALLLLAGALDYEPHALIVEFADGHVERMAATSAATCAAAIAAIDGKLWLPREPIRALSCRPGNLFAPGSTCIKGYNC